MAVHDPGRDRQGPVQHPGKGQRSQKVVRLVPKATWTVWRRPEVAGRGHSSTGPVSHFPATCAVLVSGSWQPGVIYPCRDSTRCNRFHPTSLPPQQSSRFGAEWLQGEMISVLSDGLVHCPPLWTTTYPTMQRAVLLRPVFLLLLFPPPLFFLHNKTLARQRN